MVDIITGTDSGFGCGCGIGGTSVSSDRGTGSSMCEPGTVTGADDDTDAGSILESSTGRVVVVLVLAHVVSSVSMVLALNTSAYDDTDAGTCAGTNTGTRTGTSTGAFKCEPGEGQGLYQRCLSSRQCS